MLAVDKVVAIFKVLENLKLPLIIIQSFVKSAK